ncbi:hypothetical protein BKA59DRAFT_456898 [Fusarium tricinctum]|uniref:Uncharacterized protein n=1 Tax=Fusarium tricinctum TaxID=61284 RepID=A0A8K0RXD3_9HYPO|nr:hypothetical protein BKA59DRAFT_456898 [Fusarium tricinctum]
MTSTKRTADEMSGADNSDGRTSPRAYRRLEGFIDEDYSSEETTPDPHLSSPTVTDENETSTGINKFKDHLLNGLPVNLMTADFMNYLFYTSNYRLEEAKQNGASLADIIVGEDCLLTWSGRTWDPIADSLHETIQTRLVNLDEAQKVGTLVREAILSKSKRKLDEAKALGLSLEDIRIGLNLLPVWGAAAGEAVPFLCEEEEGIEQDDMDEGEIETTSIEDDEIDHLEFTDEALINHSTGEISSHVSIVKDMAFPDTSDSDSDSEPDYDIDSEGYFDDAISVDNLFDVEPHYPNSEDDEANIFHGAEVVDLSSHPAIVDLQIYMIEDEGEIRDLPEMELCIDGEAFEQLFGSEGAIDVEIEGSQLLCTGELFQEDEEMILDKAQDGSFVDLTEGSSGDQTSQQNARPGEVAHEGSLVDLNNGTEEQNTEHEMIQDIFKETEDGFVW